MGHEDQPVSGEQPAHTRNEDSDHDVAMLESRSRDTDSGRTHASVKEDGHSSPKPDVRQRASQWQRILLDSWIPEIVALTLSTACLVTVVIVLEAFNHKPTPDLPYGITLNAAIATLATASRSMLLYTVAAAISQLKWCWFLESRKLLDLQIFDDASRGPWGSLTLLYSLRARPLATLGAVITILALAVDPFVQLVLTYPTRPVVSTALHPSLVVRAEIFDETLPSTNFSNALEAGIWSEPQQFYQQPSCPTSNCSWPKFRSMGWCAKCEDARSKAHISNCDLYDLFHRSDHHGFTGCEVSVGDGVTYPLFEGLGNHSIPGQSPDDTMSSANVATDAVWVLHTQDWGHAPKSTANGTLWPNEKGTSNTCLGVFNPVLAVARVSVTWDFEQLVATNTPRPLPAITAAEECVLSLCEMDYEISTKHGMVHTEVTDRRFGFIKEYKDDFSWPENSWVSCWQATNESMPDKALRTYFRETDDSSIFCPQAIAFPCSPDCYGSAIGASLVGNSTIPFFDPSVNSANDGVEIANQDLRNNPHRSDSSPLIQYIAANSLSKVLNGAAASLTRLGIANAKPYAFEDTSPNFVHGEAWIDQSYVETSWYWLILPFSLNIFGVVFLMLAIIQSRRKKLKPWKASILPLLYHGLEAGIESKHPDTEYVSAMEKAAEETRVQFVRSDGQAKSCLKQM